MVKRYYGGLITSRKPTANATIASGIYNKNIHLQAVYARAWPTATFIDTYVTDPLFSYNALAITGDTASYPFNADASTNNFNTTISGDTKATNFSPYASGYYSTYFDGTGQALTNTSFTGTNFGTGNFTIEMWAIWSATTSSNHTLFELTGTTRIIIGRSSTGIRYYNNGTEKGYSVTVPIGVWNHIAIVRNSGTTTIYLNGVAGTSFADTTNWAASTFHTSRNSDGSEISSAVYISNLRVVNGTAVYSTNFTPPTTPLTAISGTTLLICQSNGFKDNSTNNFPITLVGTPSVSVANPFPPVSSYATYGSAYFDGTTDYVSIPNNTATNLGTGDFTIEFWVYANITQPGTNPRLLSNDVWNTSAGYDIAIESNLVQFRSAGGTGKTCTFASSDYAQWVHLAFTRSGTTFRVFKNGVISNTYTDSSNLTSANPTYIAKYAVATGSDFAGYISDLRIIKSTAVYTGNFTPPTLSIASSGATSAASYSSTANVNTTFSSANTSLLTLQNSQPHNNSTFLDKSSFKSLVNRFGNSTQGTFTPYGVNWSNYFEGTSFITPASGVSAAMGGGFAGNIISFEMWIFPTNFNAGSYAQHITAAYQAVAANGRWYIGLEKTAAKTSKLNFGYTTGTGSQNDLSSTASAITQNAWNHIAVTIDATTASSATVKLFANGQLLDTFTGQNMSTQTTYYSVPVIGGANSSFVSNYYGYISNYRILKGVFAYTGNYTPPTSPLAAITGTALLTCQSNRFIDNSTNNFAITLSTTPKIQKFGPTALGYTYSYYNPDTYSGSTYFDGSGDYISLPNSPSHAAFSGDFTVECWFYLNSVSGTQTIVSHRSGNAGTAGYVPFILWVSSTTLTLYVSSNNSSWDVVNGASVGTVAPYQWYHLAYTRSGSTIRVLLNGVETYSFTSSAVYSTSNALQLGMTGPSETNAPLNGYISDFRITKGTGVYAGNFTPPIKPLTYAGLASIYPSASNVNTTFAATNTTVKLDFGDAGIKDYTLNTFFDFTGDVKITSANSKFGGTSMYFDGSGDYISVLNNQTLYSIGTGDFTLEMWVNPVSLSTNPCLYDTVAVNDATGTGRMGMSITSGGVVQVFTLAGSVIAQGGSITANTWNHIAYSRFSNTGNLYVNGLRVTAPVSDTTNYSVGVTYRPAIGINGYDGSSNPMYGYIDDLRLTKGNARYTANFTPAINSFALR